MNTRRFAFLLHVLFSISSLALSAQTWRWAAGSSCPKGAMESWAVAVDGLGNVYSAGIPSSTLVPFDSVKCIFGSDTVAGKEIVIVSTDSTGNYRWALGSNYGQVLDLATDSHNNLYVFGICFGSMTLGSYSISGTGGFCARITSAGTVLWLRKICDSSSFSAGCVDGSGNAYAIGSFSGTTATIGTSTVNNASLHGNSDVLIAKFDSLGNALWGRCFGGDSNEYGSSIAVGYGGEPYLLGKYNSASFSIGTTSFTRPAGLGYYYGFITKLDTWGGVEWAKQITPRDLAQFNDIAIDGIGNAYITGGYKNKIVFGSDSLAGSSSFFSYLARYDQSGNWKWAKSTNNAYYPWGHSVAADFCGNVWITSSKPLSGSTDPMIIFQYDSSGILADSILLPTGGDDPSSITFDNKGNAYIGGDYWGNYSTPYYVVASDTLWLRDSTLETMFIAKYSYPMCTLPTTLEVPALPPTGASIYPIPADHLITVQGWQGADLTITSMTGNTLLHQHLRTSTENINIGFLAPGIYIASLNDAANSRRKIVKLVKE